MTLFTTGITVLATLKYCQNKLVTVCEETKPHMHRHGLQSSQTPVWLL